MNNEPPIPRGARVEVGAWTAKGEFLGEPARLGGAGGGETNEVVHLYVGRGDGYRGITCALHSFDGGYRVLVEEQGLWEKGNSGWRLWMKKRVI